MNYPWRTLDAPLQRIPSQRGNAHRPVVIGKHRTPRRPADRRTMGPAESEAHREPAQKRRGRHRDHGPMAAAASAAQKHRLPLCNKRARLTRACAAGAEALSQQIPALHRRHRACRWIGSVSTAGGAPAFSRHDHLSAVSLVSLCAVASRSVASQSTIEINSIVATMAITSCATATLRR